MPSERLALRLRDVLANIERIRSYVGDDPATAIEDGKTKDAVERCLERIAEAARKIGGRLDPLYPDVNFPGLRKFGSVLRHDYDLIDGELVLGTVARDLPRLEAACRDALGREIAGGEAEEHGPGT